jgi:hypothetical protein
MHAQQADRGPNTAWSPVVDSLRAVNFPIDMNAQTLYETLQAGRFGSIKAVMRRLVDAVQQSSGTPQPKQIALEFAKAHQTMQGEWGDMSDTLRLAGHVELSVPARGFERNDVQRLLLTFGKAESVLPIPFAMLINLEAATAANDNS